MKMLFRIIKTLLLLLGISFSTISLSQNNFYDINQIREIRIEFSQNNWDEILDSLFTNYGENARLEGTITLDQQTFYHVGVRYKGFSSWDEDQVKSPFNIDLNYRYPNQNYQGFVKLKLSNVIRDPSFVREALSYEIARKYMPASRANFARVYVNDVYLGLYTNVEAVDKPFVQKKYNSDNHTFVKGSPANLVFPYGENANLAYSHGDDSLGYASFYKLESEYGWSDVFRLINILNNDTSQIPSVLNIDRTLWMHAFNYALLNLDSYIGYSQNYYLYEDDHGIFNPILWDLNMSFGSFRNTDGTQLNLSISEMKELNPIGILYSSSTLFSSRPLIKNLINNGTYRRMFLAHMRTIMNENIRNNEYYQRARAMQDTIDYWVLSDTNKFYSYTNFVKNIDTTIGPTSNQFPGLRDIMTGRLNYLDTLDGFSGYPEIKEITHAPEIIVTGENIQVNLKASKSARVYLYYRSSSDALFQSLKMFDDGLHNDGMLNDSIFGVNFTISGPVLQYYFYAENDSAGTFSPERAAFEYYTLQPMIEAGQLVINEISDKWVELYNTCAEDLNLRDAFLSDDSAHLLKWQFPDTIIPSHTFIILYPALSGNNTSLTFNFDIANEGGTLFLSNKKEQKIDNINYGSLNSIYTVGRYPNGYGKWCYMPQTYNKYNRTGEPVSIEFGLFPNPTSDIIWLEIENNNEAVEINVMNTEGQEILDNIPNNYTSNLESTLYELDLSRIPDGIYVIQVLTGDKTMQRKLIKIK
jgi:hypothetical protein